MQNSQFKKIEVLFTKDNYDSKNRCNKAPNKVVKIDYEKFKRNGLTIEELEAFNVPVFKYKTQITIHGLVEGLENGSRCCGYASAVINKNGSLGLRYNSIDVEKKKRLKEELHVFGWRLVHDSQSCYLERYFEVKSQEELNEKVSFFKSINDNLEKCAVGQGHIYKGNYFGRVIVAYSANYVFYEKDFNAVLNAFLDKEAAIFEAKKAEYLAEKEASAKRWAEAVEKSNAEEAEKNKIKAERAAQLIALFDAKKINVSTLKDKNKTYVLLNSSNNVWAVKPYKAFGKEGLNGYRIGLDSQNFEALKVKGELNYSRTKTTYWEKDAILLYTE